MSTSDTGPLADVDGATGYYGRLLLEALFPVESYRPEVELVAAEVAKALPLGVLVRLVDAVNHGVTRVSAMPLLTSDVTELRRAGLLAVKG